MGILCLCLRVSKHLFIVLCLHKILKWIGGLHQIKLALQLLGLLLWVVRHKYIWVCHVWRLLKWLLGLLAKTYNWLLLNNRCWFDFLFNLLWLLLSPLLTTIWRGYSDNLVNKGIVILLLFLFSIPRQSH